jgi:hypothetical protein
MNIAIGMIGAGIIGTGVFLGGLMALKYLAPTLRQIRTALDTKPPEQQPKQPESKWMVPTEDNPFLKG